MTKSAKAWTATLVVGLLSPAAGSITWAQVDPAISQQWHEAAERGEAWAQYNQGMMYSRGDGVPRDDTEATKWIRKAAEQGHPDAQNSMGAMYERGEGVPEDDAEAVTWYRKAAVQGNALAQNNLGWMLLLLLVSLLGSGGV